MPAFLWSWRFSESLRTSCLLIGFGPPPTWTGGVGPGHPHITLSKPKPGSWASIGASENHHLRISDCKGKRIGERVFAHGGAGLAEMAAWLISVTGADASAIHVAIEVPHGPVVETLLERGFNV
jgi:hypothetical protein